MPDLNELISASLGLSADQVLERRAAEGLN